MKRQELKDITELTEEESFAWMRLLDKFNSADFSIREAEMAGFTMDLLSAMIAKKWIQLTSSGNFELVDAVDWLEMQTEIVVHIDELI
jgi:hypothetical protein